MWVTIRVASSRRALSHLENLLRLGALRLRNRSSGRGWMALAMLCHWAAEATFLATRAVVAVIAQREQQVELGRWPPPAFP